VELRCLQLYCSCFFLFLLFFIVYVCLYVRNGVRMVPNIMYHHVSLSPPTTPTMVQYQHTPTTQLLSIIM
jgi:hypothetical protein